MDFRVIGPGRAGASLRDALERSGWVCRGSLTRSDDPVAAASDVDLVVIAVPDEAIAGVAARVAPGPGVVVHLSGATTLGPLAHHRRHGSVHPLVSLPDPRTGAERLLAGATFAVAGDPLTREVVCALGGRAITVPDELRALYHAAASVGANHLVALCAQVERLADRVGVPPDAYFELMTRTLDNVRAVGASRALTGPAARGDLDTLAAHLDAIGPAERELYLVLADAASALAGRPPPSPDLGSRRLHTMGPNRSPGHPTGASDVPSVLPTVAETRALLDEHRARGGTVGFVPTMGYLHDGHGSLMRAARAGVRDGSGGGDHLVVASIFVNPLQFAADEDLGSYPRDLDRDRRLAGDNGVDVIFAPSVEEMYPFGPVLTTVSVAELSSPWEGASRPTHFAGVATVVSKLFNIIGPCRAYFGEKDYQQLAVIRRMVADLSMPVTVVGCPIIREPDGLAMSSRNVYLSPRDRAAAVVLRRALDAGQREVASGQTDPAAVMATMAETVESEPRARLDYVAAVDPHTLLVPGELGPEVRLLIAARLGQTRLIDNCAATRG